MPPPPDSTFSATESITTHDTLPPSKLIARDNVLLAGLLAAFAPSMADAHRLSIDDLHPDRNLLLFLHRLSPHIGTDLTGDWLHTHPALMNNYRWLRLFYGENCIALLDEHDVAAMLTNDLGILGRLLGYAQSGRFGAVYLLLRGDCNILCFFLCGAKCLLPRRRNRQRPRRTPIQLSLQHSERLRWNGGYRPHSQTRSTRCDLRDRRPGKPHRRANLAAPERNHAGGADRWKII